VLDSRSDRTGDLLALTEENLRAERARRIAADAKSSSPDAVNIIDQVIKSFTGENK